MLNEIFLILQTYNWMDVIPNDQQNTTEGSNYSNNEGWTSASIFTTKELYILAEWMDTHCCFQLYNEVTVYYYKGDIVKS